MATAADDQPNQEAQTIRIDLTSLDLRSGTVRLPLQQHDYFAEGSLTAVTADGATEHILRFEPPRDLHGLQHFFREAELRPNDAVIIHVTSDTLQLEAFHRKARRSTKPDQETAPTSPPADSGADSEPGGPAEAAPPGSASADATPPGSTARAADGAPDPTCEEPAAAASEPEADAAEPASSEPPTVTETEPVDPAPAGSEPSSLAPAPERAARFPFLGAAAGSFTRDETEEEAGGLNGFGETFAALPAASPGDEAEPNRADGHTPTQEGTSAASPPAAGENGNFHVTRRRPFRPRERGPAYAPEKPAAPWLQAANQSRAAEAEAEAEAGGSGPKSEPTAPPRAAADAEQPAPSAGPVEAVRELLRQPDLPSIIQAADVARRLGLEPAEAASALETLSAEPDSRLSAVRPGFWLLKRAGPDG